MLSPCRRFLCDSPEGTGPGGDDPLLSAAGDGTEEKEETDQDADHAVREGVDDGKMETGLQACERDRNPLLL